MLIEVADSGLVLQVAELHHVLQRHKDTMAHVAERAVTAAKQDSYNQGDADPRSVLISSFGNGSGSGSGSGSMPSSATPDPTGRAASMQCLQSQEHAIGAAPTGTQEQAAAQHAERSAAVQGTTCVAAMASPSQQARKGLLHSACKQQAEPQPMSAQSDAAALCARNGSMNGAMQRSFFSGGSLPQDLGYQTDSAIYVNHRSQSHPGAYNLSEKASGTFGGSLPTSMRGLSRMLVSQQALAAQGYDAQGCSPRHAGCEISPFDCSNTAAEQTATLLQQQKMMAEQQQQQAMAQQAQQDQRNAMCYAAVQHAQQQSMLAGACQQRDAAAPSNQQFSNQAGGSIWPLHISSMCIP